MYSPHHPARTRAAALVAAAALLAVSCGSDDDAADQTPATIEATETSSAPPEPDAEPDTSESNGSTVQTLPSGATVTVQAAGELVVHTFMAPFEMFANATHIIETPNALVVVDTQFLLPNAVEFRAYADGLGKPIDRMYLTHDDPDHFLGSEAFEDVEIFALPAVSDSIAANGDAEVADQQASFGDAIASTYVTPTPVEPGVVEIDGVDFVLEEVLEAEAEVQLVIKVPSAGIVATGDIVYSGTHLILAGDPPTWTDALNDLKAASAEYPIVLPGHGVPTGPSVYDENIAWLATASELMDTASNGEEFKTGLLDSFPDLELEGAIDFALPVLFPDDAADEPDAG